MKFKLLHFISLIFLCAVFFGAAGQTFACLCPFQEGPPEKDVVKKAAEDATAVFSGEVVSIDSVMIEGTGVSHTLPDGKVELILPQYERWVTFRVGDVFKGDMHSGMKMRDMGTDCDFHFEAGKLYLVYADGKVLRSTICSRTALIDAKNTRKEIRILNKLKNDL